MAEHSVAPKAPTPVRVTPAVSTDVEGEADNGTHTHTLIHTHTLSHTLPHPPPQTSMLKELSRAGWLGLFQSPSPKSQS